MRVTLRPRVTSRVRLTLKDLLAFLKIKNEPISSTAVLGYLDLS